jgi:hypothetical protein
MQTNYIDYSMRSRAYSIMSRLILNVATNQSLQKSERQVALSTFIASVSNNLGCVADAWAHRARRESTSGEYALAGNWRL